MHMKSQQADATRPRDRLQFTGMRRHPAVHSLILLGLGVEANSVNGLWLKMHPGTTMQVVYFS